VQNRKPSLFNGFMQRDPANLTKLQYSHSLVNFRADPNNQNIVVGHDRVLDIKKVYGYWNKQ
jgi:hypothetical protein